VRSGCLTVHALATDPERRVFISLRAVVGPTLSLRAPVVRARSASGALSRETFGLTTRNGRAALDLLRTYIPWCWTASGTVSFLAILQCAPAADGVVDAAMASHASREDTPVTCCCQLKWVLIGSAMACPMRSDWRHHCRSSMPAAGGSVVPHEFQGISATNSATKARSLGGLTQLPVQTAGAILYGALAVSWSGASLSQPSLICACPRRSVILRLYSSRNTHRRPHIGEPDKAVSTLQDVADKPSCSGETFVHDRSLEPEAPFMPGFNPDYRGHGQPCGLTPVPGLQ